MIKMEDADSSPTSPRRKVTEADLRRVNLGRNFWSARTDRIQVEAVRKLVFRYRKDIMKMASKGSGIIFSGPLGVGKTAAAACVLKEAISAGLTTYFVTQPELRELRFEKKDSMFGNGQDGITIRKRIDTAQFLVLDGFNENFFTDNAFGTQQLEELLIRRISGKLVTIMTTRSLPTFKKEEHADLHDIVSQCMFPMKLFGKNMRDDARDEIKDLVGGDDI